MSTTVPLSRERSGAVNHPPTRSRGLLLRSVLGITIASVVFPSTALAYIDPLSGSLFIQAIVAGILGAGLSARRARERTVQTFVRLWRRVAG